ncbi:MAG: hypothetical protein E7575_07390 [Ruminococcaceae bacterium]|nr:hypothetical protein [Oscillospiraceae bacterium]
MRKYFEDSRDYLKTIDTHGIFDNTLETALPQTIVAQLVREHLDCKGDKRKRVFIYGFDGARADSMAYIIPTEDHSVSGISLPCLYSAITELKSSGGLYITFAGGAPNLPETLQKTCTMQGWASILTGVWANEHGVHENEILSESFPTVLMEYAQKGYSCCFASLWYNHFTQTYSKETEHGRKDGLHLTYRRVSDETELQSFLKEQLAAGTDIIFGINESPDENGHTGGFGGSNPFYVSSITNADRYAFEMLETIKSRPEYEDEDWLFIVTSDHGGHDRTHFDQSAEDKLTFLAINKIIE